jgi:hypothetical protein
LSKKPILAVLHQSSSACTVLRKSGAGVVLDFDGDVGVDTITDNFSNTYKEYKCFLQTYDFEEINQCEFERYSARKVTGALVESIEKALKLRRK